MKSGNGEEQNEKSLMYEILALKEEMEKVSFGLNLGWKIFGPISIGIPKLLPPELGFIKTVSYLYVTYFETAKVNLQFLTDKLVTYGLDKDFLFYWEDAEEKGSGNLSAALSKYCGIKWEKETRVEIVDDKRTINVYDEKSAISLSRNDDGSTIFVRQNGMQLRPLIAKMVGSRTGIFLDKGISEHLDTIRFMRTLLQHNLDPTGNRNQEIQRSCETWFKRHCGTTTPGDNAEWQTSLLHLLTEAVEFLNTLKLCLRKIEQDKSRDQIVRDWDFRHKRHHSPEEYDQVISEAANDMGIGNLDIVRTRKRYYTQWSKKIALLGRDYNFKAEARKIVEHTLLSDDLSVLPITGQDIIGEFGLEPGSEVGRLLRIAQQLYIANQCSREELLERLRRNK